MMLGPSRGRRGLLIANMGANPAFIMFGQEATAAVGIPLASLATLKVGGTDGLSAVVRQSVHAISALGTTVVVVGSDFTQDTV